MGDNYSTHRWTGCKQGGPPDEATSHEYVAFCADCGCENQGDPAEFPQLHYPPCEDK